MKILIGALAHETNSFCAETISFDAWMKNGYRDVYKRQDDDLCRTTSK